MKPEYLGFNHLLSIDGQCSLARTGLERHMIQRGEVTVL